MAADARRRSSPSLRDRASGGSPALPDLHRDPFDRLLVAQALVGGLVVLTPDQAIRQYPARTLW